VRHPDEAALIAAYATLSVLIFSQGCGSPQKLWFQSRTSDNIHAAPVAFTFRNNVGDVILQSRRLKALLRRAFRNPGKQPESICGQP
jgi:hypothetical protein